MTGAALTSCNDDPARQAIADSVTWQDPGLASAGASRRRLEGAARSLRARRYIVFRRVTPQAASVIMVYETAP
jgi:hypothetical protein